MELHRRQAKRLAKLLMDQLPYRLRRPQREGQLHLVWHLIADPALDAPRFNLCQNKLIARAPTALSFLDTGRTVAPECPTPTADRPAMNPDSQRRLHVRRALLNKKNGANTQSFLCPLIQFAGIAKLHQRRLTDLLRHVICLHGILVMCHFALSFDLDIEFEETVEDL